MSVVSESSILHPTLSAGTRYWFVVQPGAPDTRILWAFNELNQQGLHAVSSDGGLTWSNLTGNGPPDTQLQGAFQVNGTPVNAVPEPSTLALLGMAAVSLIGYVRLRRRQVAVA